MILIFQYAASRSLASGDNASCHGWLPSLLIRPLLTLGLCGAGASGTVFKGSWNGSVCQVSPLARALCGLCGSRCHHSCHAEFTAKMLYVMVRFWLEGVQEVAVKVFSDADCGNETLEDFRKEVGRLLGRKVDFGHSICK